MEGTSTSYKKVFDLDYLQLWHTCILFAVIFQLYYMTDGPQSLSEATTEVQKGLIVSLNQTTPEELRVKVCTS